MKSILCYLLLLFASLSSLAQNTNISNGNIFEGEPYLAIHPNNSKHIVIAWMGWTDLANQFKIKTSSSLDGGKTWSSKVEIPHTVSSYSSADPCLAFNSSGDLFLSFIDFTGTTPPVTGGVYLCKSADGGLSWGTPSEVISTNYDGDKWPIDRPWMVIDRSGESTDGTIYITTFNLNRTNPSYRPYLSVSTDNGTTFSTSYVDDTDWLAGSLNPFPMCSPAVASNGTFYGSYPSVVFTQNLRPQVILAKSNDAGNSFSYSSQIILIDNAATSAYEDAKKAGLLLANPADSNHLASIFVSAKYGDLDVFMYETKDGGNTWTSPIRVNDDPIENDRMQDLIWGDFDEEGNLVISWRDRRNSTDSTYAADNEIWAAYRANNSSSFKPNFQLTSEQVEYDSILTSSGNDFMCIKLHNDTIHATWGDTRTGNLNIWYARTTNKGETISVEKIASDGAAISVYPNPTENVLHVAGPNIDAVSLYNQSGKLILDSTNEQNLENIELDITELPMGTYILRVKSEHGVFSQKIVKN